MTDDVLDVIVRFHDVRRLRELDRAIFSLIGQSYSPLHIHLAVQRFTPEMIEETKAALAPLFAIEGAPDLSVMNWEHQEPIDARSALANLGFESAQGRYLAFLDYDDVIYPEAYALLIDQLRHSGTAIAFAGICAKEIDVYENFSYTREKKYPFVGTDLFDLFRNNFCPIHSFVIDRHQIPRQFLFFEPMLTRAEDYDFLLRICAQFPSDFSLVRTIIGDYYFKSDGSNTVITELSNSRAGRAEWEASESFIEGRRRTTRLSAAVQRSPWFKRRAPALTIRSVLDRM